MSDAAGVYSFPVRLAARRRYGVAAEPGATDAVVLDLHAARMLTQKIE